MASIKSGRGQTVPTLQAGDITVTGILANGGFSSVFKGQYRGEDAAVKAVSKDISSREGEFALRSFVHECNVIASVQHACAQAHAALICRPCCHVGVCRPTVEELPRLSVLP